MLSARPLRPPQIDWHALELKKTLPPHAPALSHPSDTSCFDVTLRGVEPPPIEPLGDYHVPARVLDAF